jgi:TonB family protein
MLQINSRPMTSNGRPQAATQSQQPRRLILALALLLVALVGLLIKDRQFWFGTEQATIESDMDAPATPAAASKSAAHTPRTATTAKKQAHTAAPATSVAAQQSGNAAVISRSVLPPLDVEVVAGDKHRKLRPAANAAHVELPNQSSILEDTNAAAATTNAAQRESLPTADSTTAPYPLLAQHMNVQGSVVLQAVIGADGVVQDLRLLSGPAILASAARQAVREWRFKPILQNGRAVETKANITVNFAIKIGDNSTKTTLAESRMTDTLIVTR